MDGLSGVDKMKTEKANMLYDAIYTLAKVCHIHNVAFAIENPGNSHFWNTSPIEKLQQEVTHHYVSFHDCCHGGERDKLTSILVNNTWLDGLEGRCDRQHRRKPWVPTVHNNKIHFATGEEAAYPWLLCERIVHAIRFAIENQGAILHQTLEQQFSDMNQSTTQRLALGALPRNEIEATSCGIHRLYMRVEQKVHERGFLCVSLWVCNEQSRLKFYSEMAKENFSG